MELSELAYLAICPKCGSVIDVKTVKENEPKREGYDDPEEKIRHYEEYGYGFNWECPCCKNKDYFPQN